MAQDSGPQFSRQGTMAQLLVGPMQFPASRPLVDSKQDLPVSKRIGLSAFHYKNELDQFTTSVGTQCELGPKDTETGSTYTGSTVTEDHSDSEDEAGPSPTAAGTTVSVAATMVEAAQAAVKAAQVAVTVVQSSVAARQDEAILGAVLAAYSAAQEVAASAMALAQTAASAPDVIRQNAIAQTALFLEEIVNLELHAAADAYDENEALVLYFACVAAQEAIQEADDLLKTETQAREEEAKKDHPGRKPDRHGLKIRYHVKDRLKHSRPSMPSHAGNCNKVTKHSSNAVVNKLCPKHSRPSMPSHAGNRNKVTKHSSNAVVNKLCPKQELREDLENESCCETNELVDAIHLQFKDSKCQKKVGQHWQRSLDNLVGSFRTFNKARKLREWKWEFLYNDDRCDHV